MARKKKSLKSKLRRADIVHVEWGDAWNSAGWTRTEARRCAPSYCNSVGAFLYENEHGIMLTMGFDHEGKNMNEHFIPRGMFVKVTKLLDQSKIKTKK